MADHETLIDALAMRAEPVRRLRPAWVRALVWTPFALGLGYFATTFSYRSAPDWSEPLAWVAAANILASLSLGIAIFIASLSSGVAGDAVRVKGWTAPAFALWLALAVVGIGVSPDPIGEIGNGGYCFTFVMTAGLPMILVAILALRRTRSLRPVKSLALAGGGIAFMAFGLLAFCHPIAMSTVDFAGHLIAALLLCAAAVLLGWKAVSV